MARAWPRIGVDIDGQVVDPATLFDPPLPVVLELGSGMGEAVTAMAIAEPDVGIFAVDVHTPGIATLVRTCEREGLANVRVALGDGVELLRTMLPPDSLRGIRAYFPDPWPKARHQKRRMIRHDVVALFADRLEPGGFIHVATDWVGYADQMLEVLSDEPALRNTYDGFAPRPEWRPVTKYEQIGLAKGHTVRDLIFTKEPRG
ncbi:MAG: tRNA (guanosine(46)-N7)-methyltransferase TrmB [Candidatus Nanopelagicales bacterium]